MEFTLVNVPPPSSALFSTELRLLVHIGCGMEVSWWGKGAAVLECGVSMTLISINMWYEPGQLPFGGSPLPAARTSPFTPCPRQVSCWLSHLLHFINPTPCPSHYFLLVSQAKAREMSCVWSRGVPPKSAPGLKDATLIGSCSP